MTGLKTIKAYRVIVYVPQEALDSYIAAIEDHIPAFLGPYDRVLWHSEIGTEQFRPLAGANPQKGGKMETSQCSSARVELVFPRNKKMLYAFLQDVLRPHHPWENPVISYQKIMIAQ